MNRQGLLGKLFVGSYRDLERSLLIVKHVTNASKVIGYKVDGDNVVFGELESFDQIPLNMADVQKPGFFRIEKGVRFRHTYSSPKTLLLPSEHIVYTISKDLEVTVQTEQDARIVFFGLKSCDIKAIEVLDRILLGRNPVYTFRRRGVEAIVVEDCLEPNENCFCGAVGSGPAVANGFDLAYARLTQDVVVFRYGSSLGEEVIAELGLKEADENVYRTYLDLIEKTKEVTSKRLIADVKSVSRALEKSVSNENLWSRLSESCIGCGNCNYVCPTCFCVEIEDIREGDISKRVAKWVGCLTYTYGMVAGAHFRPKIFMRYRHFVLHKFVFYPMQIGTVGCIGCGRCITWCPVGIDIRYTVNMLIEGR